MVCTLWHNLWRCLTIELFSCSGSHKCYARFLGQRCDSDKLIGQRSFLGIKYGIFKCIPSINCYNLRIQRVIHTHSPLKIVYLSCFKMLHIHPSLTSKLVHGNSTTNIEWNAIKTTFYWAWEVKLVIFIRHYQFRLPSRWVSGWSMAIDNHG